MNISLKILIRALLIVACTQCAFYKNNTSKKIKRTDLLSLHTFNNRSHTL